MKKTVATFIGVIVMVVALHAFKAMQESNITGKIIPENGAAQVLAIKGQDTVKAIPANGIFVFKVSPGTWQISIDAKEPMNDVKMEVLATDGKTMDLGDINLKQ